MKPRTPPSTITLLDKGCEFTGKLTFEGIVRIDGVFHGEIFSHDHLIIGEGATVDANIQVGQLEVSGTFKGTIIAREKMTVHPAGRVQGSIQAREFEVHRGAVVDGTIEMSSLREVLKVPEEGASIVPFGPTPAKRGSLPA